MASVLVVDDEAPIRNALRRAIEYAGFEVLEAGDGNEAVCLCRAHAVDIVVIDIFMPEKEGIETIRQMRKELPAVKIVAMSGGGRYGYVDVLDTATKFGAHRAFVKPFPLAELLGALRALSGSADE